jgi:DNA-binding transcriptional MerR regulator
MEAMELVKPSFPKVRGRSGRLYSHGDVRNMLRLMALTTVGYSPQEVKEYADLVNQFNKLTEPFLKKPRLQLDGAVLLFDLQDVFPEGDPANITWDDLEMAVTRKDGIFKFYQKEFDQGELLGEALQLLFKIGLKALDATVAIKKARRALRLAEHIEKGIDDVFLPGLKRPFLSPNQFAFGIVGQGIAHQLGESFKIIEKKLGKQVEGRIKKA